MALLPHRLYRRTFQLGNTKQKYQALINVVLLKSRKSKMTTERNSTFMKCGAFKHEDCFVPLLSGSRKVK